MRETLWLFIIIPAVLFHWLLKLVHLLTIFSFILNQIIYLFPRDNIIGLMSRNGKIWKTWRGENEDNYWQRLHFICFLEFSPFISSKLVFRSTYHIFTHYSTSWTNLSNRSKRFEKKLLAMSKVRTFLLVQYWSWNYTSLRSNTCLDQWESSTSWSWEMGSQRWISIEPLFGRMRDCG